MKPPAPGWYFAYGLKRIHYFYDTPSLCKLKQYGEQGYKKARIDRKIDLKENDPRICKICLNILKTYSNLENKL